MHKLTALAKTLILILAVIGLSNTACKKKEIQGPKGEPGTPGGGGNSSIKSSGSFIIALAEWEPNADSSGWEVTKNFDFITQDVVDKGAVKMYVYRGTTWWELPNTVGDLFTQFGFTTGYVTLTFTDIHGGLPERPVTSNYRLVTYSEN